MVCLKNKPLRYHEILRSLHSPVSVSVNTVIVMSHSLVDFINFVLSRDGLMKMKSAYEQNPALGDPLTLEGQLSENGYKMEKLQGELRKFQGYLADVDGKPPTPNNHRKKNNRSSVSEESLSRSASDSSVGQNHQNVRPPAPQATQFNNNINSNITPVNETNG